MLAQGLLSVPGIAGYEWPEEVICLKTKYFSIITIANRKYDKTGSTFLYADTYFVECSLENYFGTNNQPIKCELA